MCEVSEYLRARIEGMLSGEKVEWTRAQLEEILDRCRCGGKDAALRNKHGPGDRETNLVFLTPRQASVRLGVSDRTVRRWCAAGLFGEPNSIRHADRWRIPANAIERLRDGAIGG